MTMLEALWSDGRLIDLVLFFVVVEVALVAAVRQRSRRGPPFLPFLFNVLAGASLMLALREAFNARSTMMILLWLGASLVCHLVDLYFRWVRPGAGSTT